MKRKFIFSCFKKGPAIFLIVALVLALTSSITLDMVSAATSLNEIESLDYCVVIDPGHGGIDPGSIGYKTKTKESTINLAISKLLVEKLKRIGLRVVMTRENEDGLYGLSTTNYKKRDMQKRREIIKKANPQIVVSVHMNSYIRHNLRGAQVFYDKSSENSENLALCIQDQFAEKLEKSDKGIAVGDYYMLKCTPSASVIAECGFLSNEEDEKLLLSPSYQDLIAECIFVGIVNYLNLE